MSGMSATGRSPINCCIDSKSNPDASADAAFVAAVVAVVAAVGAVAEVAADAVAAAWHVLFPFVFEDHVAKHTPFDMNCTEISSPFLHMSCMYTFSSYSFLAKIQ